MFFLPSFYRVFPDVQVHRRIRRERRATRQSDAVHSHRSAMRNGNTVLFVFLLFFFVPFFVPFFSYFSLGSFSYPPLPVCGGGVCGGLLLGKKNILFQKQKKKQNKSAWLTGPKLIGGSGNRNTRQRQVRCFFLFCFLFDRDERSSKTPAVKCSCSYF